MGEEANLPPANRAVLAGLRVVPSRVEPNFEHPVCELAVVAAAAAAAPTAELRAHISGVVVPSRVTAAGLLAGVGEGAVGPVVTAAAGAPPDLELEHPEVIGGEGVVVVGVIGISAAAIIGSIGGVMMRGEGIGDIEGTERGAVGEEEFTRR